MNYYIRRPKRIRLAKRPNIVDDEVDRCVYCEDSTTPGNLVTTRLLYVKLIAVNTKYVYIFRVIKERTLRFFR